MNGKPAAARHCEAAAAALVLALAGIAQAQTCSGGPDGGMDATGNQCSQILASAAAVGARQASSDAAGGQAADGPPALTPGSSSGSTAPALDAKHEATPRADGAMRAPARIATAQSEGSQP